MTLWQVRGATQVTHTPPWMPHASLVVPGWHRPFESQQPAQLVELQASHVPVRLEQIPLQHTLSFVQCFPLRLQPGGSAPAIPPSDPSVPPTRAAPINLSALRREMLPLASPLASSSKERSLASGDIGSPFPKGRDSSAPPCYITQPH